MTTAAIPYGVHGTDAALDRGLSLEAERLRQLRHESDVVSWSLLNQRRVELLRSLHEAYADASHENWDGEGSAPADSLSFSYAQAFFFSLPHWAPNPEFTVDPDGEISAEWDYGARAVFSVSVGRDGTLTYAGLFGARKKHGVELFTDDVPEAITQGIRQAMGQAERAG